VATEPMTRQREQKLEPRFNQPAFMEPFPFLRVFAVSTPRYAARRTPLSQKEN
jgi:hypothetical protein